MVNTIFILDKAYNTARILVSNRSSQKVFWEDTYNQDFDTGAESFEFNCYADENVVEGNYVVFYYNNQYKMFTIMDIEQEHKDGRLASNCYCEISALSLLNNFVRPFSGDMNCIQFFEHVLNGTNWFVGKYSTSLLNKIQTINVTNIESAWSLIEDYKDIFECEINVRVTYENGCVTGRYIDIYDDGAMGSPTYKRFEYGRNVTGIVKQKDLYDWCTAIIVDADCDVSETIIKESDGYGFTKGAGDVILDDNANRMYNAGKNHIVGVYTGKETDPREACINAWKELQNRKAPKFDYEVTTALTMDEYEDIHLGDTVYVVDHSYDPPLMLEARVGKLELSFTDRTKNKCTLTNYKEIKSKLLSADYIKLTGTITDVINSFFPITSEGIADGAIIDGKIETTYYQQITADIVSASKVVAEDLIAKEVLAINADIVNLKANKAEITDLTAANGKITNLESDLADVKTLVNGNLTSDNIQALHLTAENTTIDNALIKNAMIDTVSADKINTGTLNTNNVIIESEDGGIVLSGSTQQFKDENGQVRVQIGKDAQGNFTFCLFSQDGKGILLDETGIKAGAVPNGLIVNDMVDNNANIAGSKLDIASVITEINGNTETIKSSVIKFDDTGQSLLVAFNTLKNKVETIENVSIEGDLSSVMEQVSTNTTQIGVIQGEITSLINNTTITKEDGTTVQLKDEYSATKQTVDEISTKIGYLETNYKKTLKSSSVQYYLSTSKTSLDGGSWEDTAPEWSQDKYMWQRMKYTYTDGSTTYGTASCVAGAKGDTGEQGPKGDKGATGEKGQSLTSSTPQWYLSTSNTTQTGGSWQDTMPQVATGKYIWQRWKNVWANPTATTYTTPVLEQIDEAVKEVISKQAEFKKTLDSISATVSENTSSLEGVSATVAQHTTDLRGVTSKISTLETNSAGLTSRLQSAENKLTKDGITNIVGDYYAAGDTTRKALSRIEQKADSVTTTVSNMKIGGTNLILNTQFEGAVAGTRTLPYWLITESCIIYSKYGQSGYNKMNTMYLGNDNANSDGSKTGYMYQTLTSERFQKNTEYTLSLDLSAENNVKGWEVCLRYYDANSNMIAEQILFDNTTNNAGHLECTFTSKNLDANMVQFCIGHKGSNNGANGYLLIVGNLMLEKGNIATGWQPSPQDMASKSIVTQTANDVRYEFKHTSGENLIYNGDARGAGNAWTDNSGGQGTFGRYISDNLGKNFYRNTNGQGFTHDWINLENNTEYYYSARIASDCDYNSDNSSTFEPMHCWCNNANTSGQAGMIVLDYNQKIVKDKWVYCYIHFKTTGDSGIKFKPFIYAPGITGSYIGATDIMLYKGSMWKSYSPNPNEVLSNTTIINKDGVNVKHSDGSRTNLNATALNFYDTSNKLYAQVQDGRYYFWNGSQYVGYMGHTAWADTNDQERVIVLASEYGCSTSLSSRKSVDGKYQTWVATFGRDTQVNDTTFHQGCTLTSPHLSGVFKLYGTSAMSDTYPAQIYHAVDGQLAMFGDNKVAIGVMNGSELRTGIMITEDGNSSNKNHMDFYGSVNMNGYPITNAQSVNSLSATSAQTYALRTMSDEESYSDPTVKTITDIFPSQTPTQGEIRWTDRETHFTSEAETGVYECYIEIPWWIAQNLENNYHVNITCTNGFYQYYVSERDPYYFIVRSDKDSMGFTFEIVGKLLDNNTTANNASIASDQYGTSASEAPDIIPEFDIIDTTPIDTASDI